MAASMLDGSVESPWRVLGNWTGSDWRSMKLQLGELIFDLDARQLRHGQAEIHLSPKAFELLSTLIEHRPRALSKQRAARTALAVDVRLRTNLPTLIDGSPRRRSATRRGRHASSGPSHRYGYAFCGEATEIVSRGRPSGGRRQLLLADQRRPPAAAADRREHPRTGPRRRHSDRVATVSRRHARIVVSETEATLEDLASKNGTYVGESPVSQAVRLKNGDEIRTGSVVFHFRMTVRGGSTATWSRAARKPR